MLCFLRPTAVGLGLVLFALTVAPTSAQAQDDDVRDGRAVWYAASGFEASLVVSGFMLAGMFALLEAAGDSSSGGGELVSAFLGASLFAGIVMGFTADANRWDPEPALAIHGGLWDFALGGLLGALLDGADETEGSALTVGPWSAIFALAGAGLATFTSYTQFERGTEATCWYLGPVVGLITGLITWLATDSWQDSGETEAVQSRRAWSAALLGFGIPVAAAHVVPFVVRD